MDQSVLRLARAVLLPAFGGLDLGDETWRFLEGGGLSVLLGETREEYVRRRMDDLRIGSERASAIRNLTQRVSSAAGGPALVAIDQELGGIERLHRLVRPLPSRAQAHAWSDEDISDACAATGVDIAGLGINLVLSPVVDVVREFSPWLYLRDLGPDASEVARIGAAYIVGIQRSGDVAATAKHFPGHSHVPTDPALVEASAVSMKDNLGPFRAAIDAGVRAVMVGPALVPTIDPQQPASTSAPVVSLLRNELGFMGVVISDDLDEPSIARGRSVPDTAVASLAAGVDLLLLAGGSQVEQTASRITEAVRAGDLSGDRLESAAARVRSLAQSLEVS